MKHAIFTLFIISILAIGVSSMVENRGILNTNYELVIVDSVEVPDLLLRGPKIYSVHPTQGSFLIIGFLDKYLYEVSKDGVILNKFPLENEGPTSVGDVSAVAYFRDGISLLGRRKILWLDKDFQPLKSVDLPPASTNSIYIGMNHLKSIRTSVGEQLLYFQGPVTTARISQPKYYRDWHFLSLANIDELTVEPFGRLHPESKFNQGRAYYEMLTKFDVAGDKLKAVVDTDTVLYTFDANGTIISHRGIPFDKFIVEKGYTMGPTGFKEQNDPRDEAGNVSHLLHVDGFDIIQYTSGLTYTAFTDIVGINRENYDRARLKQANPSKTIILKEGQLVSDYLTLPERIFELSHASPDGYLWATQKTAALEEEPEGLVLYKVAILPVK